MRSKDNYLKLGDSVFLKHLEFPSVYNTAKDDIYQVDPNGFAELARCDGTLSLRDSKFPEEFLEFCLEEGILASQDSPVRRNVIIGHNVEPSLRYLMVEITDRCNLACAHCYLGDTGDNDLPLGAVEALLEEFESMGGLRLVVTGGEPLLHPDFESINSMSAGRSFRSILVSNGTLIDDSIAASLEFQEVQISLDGMEEGHDYIRGEGSFKSAMEGIESLRRADKSVSVATMVHRRNLDELDSLESLVKRIGAVSWTLDLPCETGRLADGAGSILPGFEEAACELERAFGSEQHEPSGDWACGAHLACVKAGGMLAKCGFYDEWNGGPAAGGLREAWLKMPRMRLSDLDCDCEYLADCGGGCRFRAETTSSRTGPDPLKCRQFGVEQGGVLSYRDLVKPAMETITDGIHTDGPPLSQQ
jgi:radical SAM protein with 4Fe4S-binding SPASM domain